MDGGRRASHPNGRLGNSSACFPWPSDSSLDPWHSTPVKKKNGAAPLGANHVSIPPNSTMGRMARQTARTPPFPTDTQWLPILQDSQFAVTDLEGATIQRQRRELQLLIAELKDRDRELNAMAASHHKQLQAWEQDRQRVLALEQRCARLDDELQKRNEVIRVLTKRVRMVEFREKAVQKELSVTQQQLHKLGQKQQHISQKCEDFEEKNQSLNSTVMALSTQVGSLQVREEELSSMLKLKDKDVTEATTHMADLTGRLRDLETLLKESRSRENRLLRELEEHKRCYREASLENTHLKEELQQQVTQSSAQREEIIRLKQEQQLLHRDLALSGEGDSWKDELLVLARSKQERTESELYCLRQVCENQQNDLQLLQLNLESTREALREKTSRGSFGSKASVLEPRNSMGADREEQSPCSQVTNPMLLTEQHRERDRGQCMSGASSEISDVTMATSELTLSPTATYIHPLGQTSDGRQPERSRIESMGTWAIISTFTASPTNHRGQAERREQQEIESVEEGSLSYNSGQNFDVDHPFIPQETAGKTMTSQDTETGLEHIKTSAHDSIQGQTTPTSFKMASSGCSGITEGKGGSSVFQTTSFRDSGVTDNSCASGSTGIGQTGPQSCRTASRGHSSEGGGLAGPNSFGMASSGRDAASCTSSSVAECLTGSSYFKTAKCRSSCAQNDVQGQAVSSCESAVGAETQSEVEASHSGLDDTAPGTVMDLVAEAKTSPILLLEISPRAQQNPGYTCQDDLKCGCLDELSPPLLRVRNSGPVNGIASLPAASQRGTASGNLGVFSAAPKDGDHDFSTCSLQRLLDESRQVVAGLEHTALRPLSSLQNSDTVISPNVSQDSGTAEPHHCHTCQPTLPHRRTTLTHKVSETPPKAGPLDSTEEPRGQLDID